MNWHTRLTQARVAKNLKKIEFASLVGISTPTASQWESGEISKLSADNLMKICDVLDVNAHWLMGVPEKKKIGRAWPFEVSHAELEALGLIESLNTYINFAVFQAKDAAKQTPAKQA